MWKDTPLDSLGFKDVDGDVEMMIAPEAYPLSCNNRKRNHDEDQTLVRVLIDSITYISKVDVRQERNCGTNDISITVSSISKILYAVRFSWFSRA